MASSECDVRALQLPKAEIADRGTLRFGSGMITAVFPELQPSTTADPGAVHFGSGMIASVFPELQQPAPEIADRGTLRFGSGMITSGFPIRGWRHG